MKPLLRRSGLIALVIILATVVGCASSVPKPGDERPKSPDPQVALLDWSGFGSPAVLEIDATKVGRQTGAKLTPGPHTVRYGGSFGGSFLLGPMSWKVDRSAQIDFEAGHVYQTKRERAYGYQSREDYLWIEDATTGEIVADFPPPDRRDLLERSSRAGAKRVTRQHFESLSAYARCGDRIAQYDLAVYYLAGLEPVGRRDLARAYLWVSLATAGDPAVAAVKERIGSEMTLQQLAEATQLITDVRLGDCAAQPPTSKPTEGETN